MYMYVEVYSNYDGCVFLSFLCAGGKEEASDGEAEGDEEEEGLVSEVIWVWPKSWGWSFTVIMWCCRLGVIPLPP